MINEKNEYLYENEEYFQNLEDALKSIEYLSIELSNFNIDIKSKPWYKNIVEIYYFQAKEFYQNCKHENFDIREYNSLWIRSNFKSFASEVEKFLKFFVKNILKIKCDNFCEYIDKLNAIVEKYKNNFPEHWKRDIEYIVNYLHKLRKNYNENNHNEEKIDDNFYVVKKIGFVLDSDVLSWVSDVVYHVMLPLLWTLTEIIKNNY